jgi:hypothetical protein
MILSPPGATLRCPLPDREGEREGGGGKFPRGIGGSITLAAQRPPLNQSFAGLVPPKSDGDRAEQKPTTSRRSRHLQLTDVRSGMNGRGTPRPGVPVAGERTCTRGREGGEAGSEGTEAERTPKARGRQEAGVPEALRGSFD